MHVVFIICNIDLVKYKRSLIPSGESTYREGVASMAATLLQAGHQVSLLKLTSGISAGSFRALWRKNIKDCALAGFTVNTVDVPEVFRLSALIRELSPATRLICGGAHPTLSPESMLACAQMDFVCRGEGETILPDLLNCLSSGATTDSLGGLWVRIGAIIYRNAPRPLIKDLGSLPPPARDLPTYSDFDPGAVTDKTFFMGTRGCPYTCAYCCNKSIRSIYPNPTDYYRFKPVEMLIGEIKDYLKNNSTRNWLALYDDVMMGNKQWFSEFAERYQQEVNLHTFLAGRWEIFDSEIIVLLKKIKCMFLLIGVEVGDEILRRETLGRNQTDALMLERAALLHQERILFGLYTMVGLPGETYAKALKTVKLSAKLVRNPLLGHHSIFFPYEGTPLYKVCADEKIISDRWVKCYFSDTRLDMPDFPRAQVLHAFRKFRRFVVFYWIVFRLPGRLARTGERLLDWLW